MCRIVTLVAVLLAASPAFADAKLDRAQADFAALLRVGKPCEVRRQLAAFPPDDDGGAERFAFTERNRVLEALASKITDHYYEDARHLHTSGKRKDAAAAAWLSLVLGGHNVGLPRKEPCVWTGERPQQPDDLAALQARVGAAAVVRYGDLAYFLADGGEAARAIPLLVELLRAAPKRRATWLNLADALFAEQQWLAAEYAYLRYKYLASLPPADARADAIVAARLTQFAGKVATQAVVKRRWGDDQREVETYGVNELPRDALDFDPRRDVQHGPAALITTRRSLVLNGLPLLAGTTVALRPDQMDQTFGDRVVIEAMPPQNGKRGAAYAAAFGLPLAEDVPPIADGFDAKRGFVLLDYGPVVATLAEPITVAGLELAADARIAFDYEGRVRFGTLRRSVDPSLPLRVGSLVELDRRRQLCRLTLAEPARVRGLLLAADVEQYFCAGAKLTAAEAVAIRGVTLPPGTRIEGRMTGHDGDLAPLLSLAQAVKAGGSSKVPQARSHTEK